MVSTVAFTMKMPSLTGISTNWCLMGFSGVTSETGPRESPEISVTPSCPKKCTATEEKPWWGTITMSTSKPWLSAGVLVSAKCRPRAAVDLSEATAATMFSARCAVLGVLRGVFTAGLAAPSSCAASSHAVSRLQLASITSKPARASGLNIRLPPGPNTRARLALARKYGWIVDRRQLLEQVGDVPLPEARVGEPGEGARKCRVMPAVRDPARVMQHAQAAQTFHQRQFGEIELAKQLITLHERSPGRLLAGGIARQEHPQVLDARPRHAVVEIDKQGSVLAPQDVAGVAIAVNAHRRQRTEGLERLSDSSDHLFADPRILIFERLGYKAAVHDQPPRLAAQPLQRQRWAAREARAGADRVHSRECAT